jgi:hypothetical protein
MCYDASFVVFVVLKQVIEALTSPEILGKIMPMLSDKISESITDSINSSVEASIKALMDEHIIVCRVCCFEVAGRSSGLSGVRLLLGLPGVSSVFSDDNSDCLCPKNGK